MTRGIDLLLADHDRRVAAGETLDVQFIADPGVTDLTWGHPDPTLLDPAALRTAADAVLTDEGWRAMTYGYSNGPAVLREALGSHLAGLGERRPMLDELFVTGGNSAGLQLVLHLFTRPGDVVLVESPTYFLGIRILRDAPVQLVGVGTDDGGIDPVALDRAAAAAASNGGRRLLYTVPTHNNPTGSTMSTARRHEVLAVAARHGLTVVEDDVYREVSWGQRPGIDLPESLWSLADPFGVDVIRLGSFAKTLGPGLRLGFLTAPAPIVATLVESGLVDSGGGLNHLTASIVGRMVADGSYARARDRAVASYAQRCRALSASLASPALDVREPGGGYFVWARLADGSDNAAFLVAARQAGVAVSSGRNFYVGAPDLSRVRVSFSLYEADALAAAGRVLVEVAESLVA